MVKGEKEWLNSGLAEYKISLKNSEAKLEKEQIKSQDFVRELKRMEQECKILHGGKHFQHKSTAKVVINTPENIRGAERHR